MQSLLDSVDFDLDKALDTLQEPAETNQLITNLELR
jgi:hypothetical protein